MRVTYARALMQNEVNPDMQDIIIKGKSWFYIELDTGEKFDLMATDLEQAKRYAVGNYGEVH